jgi:hypothetical protein
LCVLVAAACGGDDGTIRVSVISAPGSELLSQVQRLRATLGSPRKVVEAERDGDGELVLDLEANADGRATDVFLEGFNEAGARIAVGRSGPVPLSAIDIGINVYMAEPLSVELSPAELDPPRSLPGATELSFGALFAGGFDDDGPIDDLDIYSVYLHSLSSGADMPEALGNPSVMTGSAGFVYLLGGVDAAGEVVNSTRAFDTQTPPAGAYFDLALPAELARAGASSAPAGSELFLLSGDPALVLDGFVGSARALRNGEALDGQAVTVASAAQGVQVIFGGADVDDAAALYDSGTVVRLTGPDELRRRHHRGLTLASGDAIFLGGTIDGVAVSSAVIYRAESSSFEIIELLATPRRDPAVAITGDYLVVAGGADDAGAPVDSVEVFDATTLDPVVSTTLNTPRKDAVALALVNGQVLIAGGVDADGNALGSIELFTPDQ